MQEIKVVKGYIAGVDRESEQVRVSSPYARAAVVIDTYDSASHEICVNSQLQAELVFEIGNGRELEVVCGNLKKQSYIRMPSLENIEKMILQEEFISATIVENRQIIIQMNEICWYRVGGPEPYHDSVTLEILVSTPYFEECINKVEKILISNAFQIEWIEGQSVPSKVSWWERFLEILFG